MEKTVWTEDCKLAACLVVLGCEPSKTQPTVPITNEDTGKQRVRFHFEDSVDARRYIRAWIDRKEWEKFVAADPDHRLIYMRYAFTMRERYLDAVKQSATLHIRKSDKVAGAFEIIAKPNNQVNRE